jgi:O-antigen/teichoic acid export membrane protein
VYYNGIYAVTLKFPAVLSIVASVFQIAWQDSAIAEYRSADRNAYYSKVFRIYMTVILSVVLLAIPVTATSFRYLLGSQYAESYAYIPLLFLSSAFSIFALFYGTGYVSSRRTIGAFTTTLVAGCLNVSLGYALFSHVQLYGIVISSLISSLFLWLLRAVTMKSYFQIRVDWGLLVILLTLIGSFTGCYHFASRAVNLFLVPVGLGIGWYLNKDTTRHVFELSRKFLKLILRPEGAM